MFSLIEKEHRLSKPNINLYLGDFFDVAAQLPDDAADITVTSPPYNMNLRISKTAKGYRHHSRQVVKELSTKYREYDDNLPLEDYLDFNRRALRECLRISPLVVYNIQFLTGNKSALFKLIGEFADEIKEVIIWDKVNAQPAIGEGVLNSQFEVLLILDRNDAPTRRFVRPFFERGTLSNVWQVKRGGKKHKDHGAVFPDELIRTVLKNFSAVGDTVFDPFMGVGTAGIVARAMDRSFIGVEIDPHYFKYAQNRVAPDRGNCVIRRIYDEDTEAIL